MGCSSSKAATIDVYRPPPSSFAVFDISSIQEPWLSLDNINGTGLEKQEKPTHVPTSILEKLNKFENDSPHSWQEVSKALEDLKPTLNNKPVITHHPSAKTATAAANNEEKKQDPRKRFSFHTLEELDAKLSSKPEKELRKTESLKTEAKKISVATTTTTTESRPNYTESTKSTSAGVDGGGVVIKPLKDNIFILRDREEREKEGRAANYDKIMAAKRNPLSEFPEKCPPGGADSVVVYTTSLRGVRKTYEDCLRVKDLFDVHRVVYDERDVSLHGQFLNELKELTQDGETTGVAAPVPRVFVKGRYIGGMKEIDELEETGRLGRIMSYARVERGVGRQACEGCGGARFVPCLDCGGSCKVILDDGVKERCSKCNENGLVLCPACL